MFSFLKKKPVPNWAASMDAKQYSAFTKSLERHLRKWGIYSYRFDDEGGLILAWEASVGALKYRLNLSRMALPCAMAGIKEYDAIMTRSLDVFERMSELVRSLDSSGFDRVKRYLGVRVYGEDYLMAVGENAVIRKIADGLYGLLVYDLPDVVKIIERKTAASWELSDEELFRAGLENIGSNYLLEPSPREVDGFRCLVVAGEHLFAPNIVFEMEKHRELLGPHGALLGVPFSRGVFVHPLEETEIISKISNLVHLTATLYEGEDGPSAISPRLYWYKDSIFTDIPYEMVDDGLNFFPPPNFSELVMRLQPPDASDRP